MVVQELLGKEASVLAVDENGQRASHWRLCLLASALTSRLFSRQVTHRRCRARPTATWPTAWRSS